mgnify:FL=1
MKNRCEAPIGVFDSGVGGLTVVREIMRNLPNEEIVYFGDTARVPYGSKSKETVTRYSRQIVRFLQSKEVKAIVDQAYSRCEEILTRCRKELELTAQYLLTHETMSGETFARVFTDPDGEEFTALPSQK